MLEKKYNANIAEKEMQKLWADLKTFKFNGPDERPLYSVDTPPPTISGSLHMGHIFSFTQAEMAVRYKRLMGNNIYYPLGFDDNGHPTERLVEKEEGILAKDMPRSEFIKMCEATSHKYMEEFKDLFNSMGLSVDWDLTYDTINELSRKVSQRSFIDLVKKGKAYRAEEPALWCPNCQTSIAQVDLDNEEKDSYFNYINFMVGKDKLEIATTRPEYLGACVAIFVHPEDKRFAKYVGKKATVPLYENEVPIIADDKVAIDKGTGVVMSCTYGDITDKEWQRQYNLPYVKLMGPDGVIETAIKIVGGMPTMEARLKIVEELNKAGLLVKSEKITHNVSVHERCGTEIEIIMSKQWNIDILSIKDELIAAADQIKWHPESMKNRYLIWVNNLKWDWLISRQRYYGVPFPVWYCKDCGQIILAEDSELPVNPLEQSPSNVCSCGCTEVIPEADVMDTWATSSVTPLINMRYGESDEKTYLYPMSMRNHAHEIIRSWSFYTIVKSLYHTGQVPWKELMISGFVLAKKGEKISKSKNNSKNSPQELVATYGADMIRYWGASNKLGTDTWFSEEDVAATRRFFTKLWNATNFSVMHLEDYDPKADVELMAVDKWILNKLQLTSKKYSEYMDKYEIGLARQEVDNFFWKDFCDYYLEIVKDRLYKPEVHGVEARKSGQKALYTVLLEIIKLYSPIIPHMTEYIYQQVFRENEKINTLSEYVYNKVNIEKEYVLFGEEIKEVISEVRKFKTDNGMSMKDELALLTITTNEANSELMKKTMLDIQACTSALKIEFKVSEKTSIEIVK